MLYTITTADLIYVNEAAKSLKQRDFMFKGLTLIGLDNIYSYVTYTKLDARKVMGVNSTAVMNAKELSAFVKTITTESSFTSDVFGTLTTNAGGIMHCYSALFDDIDRQYNIATEILSNKPVYECKLDDLADELRDMHKADGAIHRIIGGEFYVTVFPGMFPLIKSDKLECSIYYDGYSPSFNVCYIVRKKGFTITSVVAYLKI